MSPTQSDMGRYSSINVIIREEFPIDKDYFRKDFNSERNRTKKEWFMKTEVEFRNKIRELWYGDMEKLRTNIPFFTWFLPYLKWHGFRHPLMYTTIEVQSRLTKT